jgi:hypothetical protein
MGRSGDVDRVERFSRPVDGRDLAVGGRFGQDESRSGS